MIADFEADGALPPGVHEATWEEFEARYGTNPHREGLLVGLKRALDELVAAGCRRVYVNGSFVTNCEYPNDFDGCWEPDGVDPGLLDPVLLDTRFPRAAQKAKYGGELFPTSAPADAGFTMLEFFQLDRDGREKGIISITPSDETWPLG